ncbi:13555_t:CDS:2 [Entrophospora sp. SA101]|nr:2894_t:CDS:2 [Entrophospora sp. SA101]CAJ0641983.1 13555_t:CDS:2 [Entrophospora sp. SA101]CAJ0841490.1 11831_t:CDS:2 [Entrophospora sp. SA101]CAJ0906689.1 12239_t:CDS:2 [Entrophospora sp. SA101]
MSLAANDNDQDIYYMKLAIEQANLSKPIPTAYCVGALIVKDSKILSTGYSRELEGNTHAEECALLKLTSSSNDITAAKDATMYTTMEPCSKRLSNNKPCVERIIESKIIKKVVLGVREPDKFVEKCEGIDLLRKNGIEVVSVSSLEDECLKPNKHVLQ